MKKQPTRDTRTQTNQLTAPQLEAVRGGDGRSYVTGYTTAK